MWCQHPRLPWEQQLRCKCQLPNPILPPHVYDVGGADTGLDPVLQCRIDLSLWLVPGCAETHARLLGHHLLLGGLSQSLSPLSYLCLCAARRYPHVRRNQVAHALHTHFISVPHSCVLQVVAFATSSVDALVPAAPAETALERKPANLLRCVSHRVFSIGGRKCSRVPLAGGVRWRSQRGLSAAGRAQPAAACVPCACMALLSNGTPQADMTASRMQ